MLLSNTQIPWHYCSDCAVFTWFDSDHSTFPRSCFLYSRCNKAIETVNSITGIFWKSLAKQCLLSLGPPSCVCGKKMACQGVSNNFVGFKVTQINDSSSLSCHNAMFVEDYLQHILINKKYGSLNILKTD